MTTTKVKYAMCVLFVALALSSCKQYENFTAYFNTYYNADRLMKEAEEEFEYQDEKKRVQPRIVVPEPKVKIEVPRTSGMPPFMQEFIVSRVKRQPVGVKLDSIIIKGSKILAHKPKSNYIQDVLYLMAKTYFYKEEWLPSQIKCSELIDKYPDGDLSPDAHFLLSLNLIIQQKYYAGKLMLSRTVDIAWQKKRYDILSDAFRIEAELALFQNDLPGALKPYLQAVAQSDDGLTKAKWQIELASLLFRLGMFERAEKEFAVALKYNPDYLGIFEANLFRAASMIRLGRIYEAEKILDKLDNDGKFTEWKAYVLAQRMQIARYNDDVPAMEQFERTSDSLYNVHPASSAFAFERGMDLYEKNEYSKARMYFARARAHRIPIYAQADQMYQLLNNWDTFTNRTFPTLQRINNKEEVFDTTLKLLSYDLFELGRVHTQLRNADSALYYYTLAANLSPSADTNTARYLYVWSYYLKDTDLRVSDSLLEVIVEKYPRTQFGREAMSKLGYTSAFLLDSLNELYSSGRDLMKHSEYNFAISQFNKIYHNYPNSKFAPRSLYNIGWMYEKPLQNPDSSFYYYSLLLEKYPNSEYAEDVKLSVLYLSAVKSGGEIPDSLKTPQAVKYEKKEVQKHDPNFNPNLPESKEKSLKDMLKPKNLMQRAKDMLNEPVKEIENLKNMDYKDLMPVNPMAPDSTNIEQKPIEESKPIEEPKEKQK